MAAVTAAAGWLTVGLSGLAGCDRAGPSFKNADITGANYAQDFKLTGHDGKTYTLADFKGKVVVIFFGFTQCPDVCPTNLMELAEAKKRLGAEGNQIQVLFVTLDPERDTRQVMAQYTTSFDPTAIGLFADPETTAQTAKSFKVFYQKVPGKTPDTYTLEHTAGSYVFDRAGKVRLFVRHGQGLDALTHDLKQLVELG